MIGSARNTPCQGTGANTINAKEHHTMPKLKVKPSSQGELDLRANAAKSTLSPLEEKYLGLPIDPDIRVMLGNYFLEVTATNMVEEDVYPACFGIVEYLAGSNNAELKALKSIKRAHIKTIIKMALHDDKDVPRYARMYIEDKVVEIDIANRMKAIGIELHFNVRSARVEVKWDKLGEGWFPLTDYFNTIRSALQKYATSRPLFNEKKVQVGLKRDLPSQDHFKMAEEAIAVNNPYDPVKEYLEGLEWDGTKRLKRLLEACFEVDKQTRPMARFGIPSFMRAAVMRTYAPGSKYDLVPVLISDQEGIGKSLFCEYLVPEHLRHTFNDNIDLSAMPQALVEQTLGSWINELQEMKGTMKAGQQSLYAYISRNWDRIRLPFRADRSDYPRRFVFIGTVNGDKLPVMAGAEGRRFMALKVEGYDDSRVGSAKHVIAVLDKEREQLWAEAVHLYKTNSKKFPTYIPKELEEVNRQLVSDARRRDDALEGAMRDYFFAKEIPAGTVLIWSDFTEYLRNSGIRFSNYQLTEILRDMGFKKVRKQYRVNGKRVWGNVGWIVPEGLSPAKPPAKK